MPYLEFSVKKLKLKNQEPKTTIYDKSVMDKICSNK